MKTGCASLIAVLAACSGKEEDFFVAPDHKHVIVRSGPSFRSIDIETLVEVGRADITDPPSILYFSRDGSRFVVRNTRSDLVVVAAAGGPQVNLAPVVDRGKISFDGTRVAFLQNAGQCSNGAASCADLLSAPSAGGGAVRVASGIPFEPYVFAGSDTLIFENVDRALMSVRADGSAAPVLLASAFERAPGAPPIAPFVSVLRDGHIVVKDGTGLTLMDAQGGARVHIGDANSDLFCDRHADTNVTLDGSCPVSAAGTLAVITPAESGLSTIQLVSLDGAVLSTVTASINRMVFDTDGRFVFFDETNSLAQVLPSGEVRRLPFSKEILDKLSLDGKWASFPVRTPPYCAECWGVQVISTVTGFPSPTISGPVSESEFSPDSRSVLTRTPDRKLFVVPVEGGNPRLIETDVDAAQWAGPRRIVISRTQSPPKGVSILDVR